MRKTIFTIVSIMFTGLICWSQGMGVRYKLCTTCTLANHDDTSQVFTYNAPQAFNSSHVTSDYGPRDYGTDHYDWHGGIDYSTEAGNADIGNGLVAIDAGTINTLTIGAAGYKYITIDGNNHDFGYGHLFTQDNPRTQNGNYLKSGNFFIALRDLGDSTLQQDYVLITEDGRALYTTNIDTVTHPITGVRIATTNTIANNNLTVGPLGNSIAVGRSVPAHLHLYLFENNNHAIGDAHTKNPLQYVTHDQPDYDVVWYRVSANGVEEEISIASGIQGNDDGEDLANVTDGNIYDPSYGTGPFTDINDYYSSSLEGEGSRLIYFYDSFSGTETMEEIIWIESTY